jgi:hypothetical protein
MRLTKLLVMGGLAYLGYKMYCDVQEQIAHRSGGGGDLEGALDEESGRMQTLTGPGRGASEGIADTAGGFRSVSVGRGVTH